MRIFKLTALPVVIALLSFGCSNDDKGTGPEDPQNTNSTTWDGVGQFWVTTLDATSNDEYTYYSFAEKDVVEMTDAEAANSTEWDIAFKRYHVVTNGGVYGAGNVVAANLVLAGETDTLGFLNVTAADTAGLSSSDWIETNYNRVIDNYFSFNTQTFSLEMTDIVYAMRDATGNYLKVQFLDITGGGAPPTMGDIELRYVHQPTAASTDLTGTVETDTIHSTADTVFYDFSSQSYTLGNRPADPLSWDMALFHYEVILNSSIGGSGAAAANPIDIVSLGAIDSTDFDGYTQAETTPQAYSVDFISSALEMAEVGTDGAENNWYLYQNMKIYSRKYTYVIRNGDDYYKLYMVSYYDPNNPSTSGVLTFNWNEL